MPPRQATTADWPAVRDLLVRASLPVDGAEKAFETGLVAVENDRVVGCAAIETYNATALL
jgi:N-acetylglutamate synthase-like GNAT family acetyltransferase